MKFTIQPTERKEFVNLPARTREGEPDDFIRALRNRPLEQDREMLGQTNMAPAEDAVSGSAESGQLERLLIGGEEKMSEEFYEQADEHADGFEDDEWDATEALWKRSKWPAAIFLTALSILGALWYFASRSDSDLRLANVKIEGANLLSNREVLALAAIDRSVPFYKIDLKPIELRLLRHSLVRSARVRRELDPATLVITIDERQPVAFLRSDSNGEAFIIDHDGLLLRPKLIAGLRDPMRLLQVPLLSGVTEHDTAGYQAMAKMVLTIAALDSGALTNAIGELHRTPTGDYVIYTSTTQTPMFIGSPFEHEFRTALEEQAGTAPKYSEPLFERQLDLLAHAWKANLQQALLTGHALYVDARFNGQIILKQRTPMGTIANGLAMAPQLHTNNAHYATNAIQQRTGY